MHNIKILIVEDELNLQQLTKKYLVREKYQVFTASTGKEALSIFDNNEIDLIVLDLMLPDMSGFKIGERIRSYSEVPIIMLTARSEEQDKLDGFNSGADDYMTKPFSPRELLARIKAILKRNKKLLSSSEYTYGNFKLCTKSNSASINDIIVDLTPGELQLVYYLILNKNMTLTREQILDRIWGFDYDGDIRTVDTRIKRLRKKLANADINIETVRGIGYRLEEKS
jgi:two-component system, OmpR family, response regulator ResD